MRVALTVVALGLVIATTAGASSYRWANVSWYGPGLYGNHLGCGGTLYAGTWGVANKFLRCGTLVRLCYHRCVNSRVIDRGPYIAGRDFDLTYPVMRAIGMHGGVATIKYAVLGR